MSDKDAYKSEICSESRRDPRRSFFQKARDGGSLSSVDISRWEKVCLSANFIVSAQFVTSAREEIKYSQNAENDQRSRDYDGCGVGVCHPAQHHWETVI